MINVIKCLNFSQIPLTKTIRPCILADDKNTMGIPVECRPWMSFCNEQSNAIDQISWQTIIFWLILDFSRHVISHSKIACKRSGVRRHCSAMRMWWLKTYKLKSDRQYFHVTHLFSFGWKLFPKPQALEQSFNS